MDPYRFRVRVVATLDFFICIVELICYWWNRDPVVWPESYLDMELIVSEVLCLQILAALNLFVATFNGNVPAGAILLCKFWLILNVIWICLEVLVVLVLILILLTMGREYGALLARWTSTYIMFLQFETCIRLMGMYIVVKFIEEIKLVTVETPRGIPLMELAEAALINV